MNIYIVCAIWQSTKDNHAGMYHLAKTIKEKYKHDNVQIIGIPTRQLGPFNILYRLYNIYIGFQLLNKIKKGDIVFLMEYFLPLCEQSHIAKLLKGKAKIIAIAHSIPTTIDRLYSKKTLQKKASYVDSLLVLGSSLKRHLVQCGIPSSKITTTFHYVDNSYYRFERKQIEATKDIHVICMGNMARDYKCLSEIVSKTPYIKYYICKGRASIGSLFSKYSNVSLIGFVSEQELRDYMQKSDISLNLMKDTVGSNVITTSLASGLAMICSNVGSIKDYVTTDIGYLFNNKDEAVNYLNLLNKNREKLYSLQKASLEKAIMIDIEMFLDWFYTFIKKL